MLVARGEEKLLETKAGDRSAGRHVLVMYTADISDLASCDALVARVLEEHGGCDYLINNAGRSIRRGVINSFDRFHDFERTMQLNYFGAMRLIIGFLPKMIEQKRGHIINISSIGVLSNAPRFSAYVASKSALDSFSACAASEFLDKDINFTTINMPLVRTPMIAPTKMYENVPTLSPEEAAGLVVEAIVHKPVRIATRLGIFGAVCHAIAPKLTQVLLNTAFNMFPDSSAAQGKEGRRAAAAFARADGFRAAHAGDPLVGNAGQRSGQRCISAAPAVAFVNGVGDVFRQLRGRYSASAMAKYISDPIYPKRRASVRAATISACVRSNTSWSPSSALCPTPITRDVRRTGELRRRLRCDHRVVPRP